MFLVLSYQSIVIFFKATNVLSINIFSSKYPLCDGTRVIWYGEFLCLTTVLSQLDLYSQKVKLIDGPSQMSKSKPTALKPGPDKSPSNMAASSQYQSQFFLPYDLFRSFYTAEVQCPPHAESGGSCSTSWQPSEEEKPVMTTGCFYRQQFVSVMK